MKKFKLPLKIAKEQGEQQVCLVTNQNLKSPTQPSLSLVTPMCIFHFKANQWVNAQGQLHQQKLELCVVLKLLTSRGEWHLLPKLQLFQDVFCCAVLHVCTSEHTVLVGEQVGLENSYKIKV